MGRIRSFCHINWEPYEIQVGNIKATNFYLDDGKETSFPTHTNPQFSYFRIEYILPNKYFGQRDTMLTNGFVEYDGGIKKDNLHLSNEIFKLPTSSLTIAHWLNLDHDECNPNLSFIGARPLKLNELDWLHFKRVAASAQNHISTILLNHKERIG